MCEYLKALQKPFPAEDIEWRVSHCRMTKNGPQALVLAYVTNRAIMERLDEVFGIAGWKNEYQEWREKGVLCTITCKVENEWIAKSDGADETDMESTKGGFSASMKRAAVQWGIGRYLYNLGSTWVPIMDRGQNHISTQTKQREAIKGYWDTPKLPKWALPENYEAQEPKPQEPEYVPDEDIPPPPPSDEDLAAIAAASQQTYGTPSETTKASEGQKRMLNAKASAAGYKPKDKADLMEAVGILLGRTIESFNEVEKSEVNKVAQWLDAQKAAS